VAEAEGPKTARVLQEVSEEGERAAVREAELSGKVSEGLERVVMRCLAKNRDERYGDVGELAKALVPFGSGSWIQSADRVVATLARGNDEVASGPRFQGTPTAAERVAIPSAPARRLDSGQPELHGTASTVARSFTLFDSQRRLMLLTVGAMIVGVSVFVGVLVFWRRSPPAVIMPVTAASVDPPPPDTSPINLGPATQVTTGPVHTAGPENEMGGAPPAGTVIGASSPAATTAPPSVSAGATSTSRKLAPPTAPTRKGTSPSGTSPPRNKLPAGLPPSRD